MRTALRGGSVADVVAYFFHWFIPGSDNGAFGSKFNQVIEASNVVDIRPPQVLIGTMEKEESQIGGIRSRSTPNLQVFILLIQSQQHLLISSLVQ